MKIIYFVISLFFLFIVEEFISNYLEKIYGFLPLVFKIVIIVGLIFALWSIKK